MTKELQYHKVSWLKMAELDEGCPEFADRKEVKTLMSYVWLLELNVLAKERDRMMVPL